MTLATASSLVFTLPAAARLAGRVELHRPEPPAPGVDDPERQPDDGGGGPPDPPSPQHPPEGDPPSREPPERVGAVRAVSLVPHAGTAALARRRGRCQGAPRAARVT